MPNSPELMSFVGRDGVLYTERVDSLKPPVYPHLSRWQRVARQLTPKRWRKPLQPIRNDPLARHQRMVTNMVATIDKLTNPRPWWKFWA